MSNLAQLLKCPPQPPWDCQELGVVAMGVVKMHRQAKIKCMQNCQGQKKLLGLSFPWLSHPKPQNQSSVSALIPNHGGDTTSKKKASCQLRLAQKKCSALRAIAIDSPFSSPTQTRALSLIPNHHYHLSLLRGYKVKMKSLNSP